MYPSLRHCINDLEKNGHLIRIKELVDPHLEMASIHLRVHAAKGPAILFENIKGSKYTAVSNLFGTKERSEFIFRKTIGRVKRLIDLKDKPIELIKQPLRNFSLLKTAYYSQPRKITASRTFTEITIDQLPMVKCWPADGGAFITLPQVYTEDPSSPGILHSNLGMYRIQLSGNSYERNKEIGLHYQIHRGIGVHQSKANALGKPLRVSVFIGGPPAHSFAAVMPLPEGMSELTFAGAMAGRRFRYYYEDGFLISADADFVITGEVYPGENKPEGPFGDHLGYYSLVHDFPLMRVKKVYAKKDAIYPFTVVGRPPQEDTQFGALIHEITGSILPDEIPGLKQVNAVDAAGVHPLLLAIGSERYTPFIKERKPQEILTIANHILGFGQMSLAKYLFIAATEDNPELNAKNIASFFIHCLERIDFTRDLHFHTNTTIDTLDYSGKGLNSGSKVIIAAAGPKIRDLSDTIPPGFKDSVDAEFGNPNLVFRGVLVIEAPAYTNDEVAEQQMLRLSNYLKNKFHGFPLVVVADDASFSALTLNNFLWVTFTRSNPASDIYGIDSFIHKKHWGCRDSMIIDARIKPHHAPVLQPEPEIEKKVDALGLPGKSLHGII